MEIVSIGFIVIIALFALRGAMLGFLVLLVRLCGIVAAALVAYYYQQAAVLWLLDIWPYFSISLASLLASVGLFMLVLLPIILCLQLLLVLLGANNGQKTLAGRIGGAAVNASIGVVFCLLGLWAYSQAGSLFDKMPPVPDGPIGLQKTAQVLGDAIFGEVLATAYAHEGPENQAEPLQGIPIRAEVRQADRVSAADIQQLLQSEAVRNELIPALQELVNEPEKAQQMVDQHLPLLGRILRSDAVNFKSRDPERTGRLAEQLRYMINHPEDIEKWLEDPAVQQALDDYQKQ